MLNKKVKVILFMFLVLFFIAAANAETNDDDTYTQSVEIMNVENENYVATISEEVGSFAELNGTINGNGNGTKNTINLTKNYTYMDSDNSYANLKNGISINRNLTIDGQGHTIDGNHISRIFNVMSKANLTLKNINMVNGNSSVGGAIYSNGANLTIINSTFNNNSIITTTSTSNSNHYGGAIYSSGGNLIISNSTFNNNFINTTVISSSYGISDYGGAIYVIGGNLIISNSTFNNNFITSKNSNRNSYISGGAIYISSGSDRVHCTFSIVNSTFNNNYLFIQSEWNHATGGAIYIGSGIDIVNNITDSVFTNNYANNSGGAVYSSFSSMNITNSTFVNNRAVSGGAISGSGNVINSTFMNNRANIGNTYGSGGAISGSGNVISSTFINNTGANGGAVYSSGNINNSTFINNTALSRGGAICYSQVAKGTNLANCIFLNNLAYGDNINNLGGGAVFIDSVYNYSFNILNCSFVNNTSNDCGGAISSRANVNLINSTFINNSAKKGGIIYKYVYYGDVGIFNSTFINNSAEEGGVIYNFYYNTVTVTNSTFVNNTAINGGAIYANTDKLHINNSTFVNNSATNGGALYINSGNIANSTFIGNNATNGGAIYINWGYALINNSKFISNNATKGGAIYYMNNYIYEYIDANSRYYEGYYEDYLDYLELLEEIKNLNPNDFDNIQDYLDELEYYLKEIRNYQDDLEEYFSYLEDLEYYGNVSITVTNSEFDKNQGEFGDDIYTGWNTTVLNNTYTKDSFANIYANNTIVNCSVVTVLNNGTYYITPDGKFVINATVFADGASVNGYNLTITDGTNNYNTKYLGYGVYQITENITANFTINHYSAIINNKTNDTNYIVKNGTVTTNNKKNIKININVEDTVYGEDVIIEITLTEEDGTLSDFTGQITVEVDGENYTVEITNGTGKLVIKDKLDVNNYTVTATFNETEEYNPSQNTADFEIGKADPNLDVNITEIDGNLTMDIIMNPDINGNVTVIIDNETFVVEIRNGSGKLDLSNLESGVHEFGVEFEGNNNYNPAETAGEFDTKGIVLEADYLTKYYGSDKKLNIRLRDTLGNPLPNQNVTIEINGVTYIRTTDENGQILMSINLIPGIYQTIILYENITEKVNVTVLTTIEAENLVKYFKNGSQYYAKFYNLDGTPLANKNVTFNIHGVFYNRTTDNDGIAKLNINLNPGEYIITAWNPVNNESKANNITVLSTIFGKNVIKYYRNGTQYYARALDENGNPLANANVTFNIHGVFYNRTTNNEGIVKLNINLNPGKYIITAWNLWNGEAKSNNITVYTVVKSQDLEMTINNRKPFKVTILGEQGKPLANTQVSFNIHGVFYHKTTDSNGEVSLDINLISGKYIITTYYNEYSVSNTIVVK